METQRVAVTNDGTPEHVHVHAGGAPNPVPAGPPRKNRATRRQHGQKRRRALRITRGGKGSTNGPQRAAQRAAAVGLVVGRPVRADLGAMPLNWAPSQRFKLPGDRLPGTPLEFADRLVNYKVQAGCVSGVMPGRKWRASAKQRRRCTHKSRTAALRKYVAGKREEAAYAAAHPAEFAAAQAG